MLIEFRLDLLKLLLGILSVLRLERLNDFQRLLFQFEPGVFSGVRVAQFYASSIVSRAR